MTIEESGLVGLHHVQLAMPPGEEDAAVRFYARSWAWTQVPKPPTCSRRGAACGSHGRPRGASGGRGDLVPAREKAHPAFLVRGLETLRARIEAAGYRVTDTVQIEGFHRVYVRDPFGNRVELIEAA